MAESWNISVHWKLFEITFVTNSKISFWFKKFLFIQFLKKIQLVEVMKVFLSSETLEYHKKLFLILDVRNDASWS